MSELKRQFGQRIRFLRLQKQMTQEKLAETADISTDFLSLIERGRNAPSFDTLEKLAAALEVQVHQLFKFTKE